MTSAELIRVLTNENKFVKYLSMYSRQQFLQKLLKKSHPVQVEAVIRECRDPKDDKFLELAVSGNADILVSGDKDLLDMHPFRGIPILSPSESLAGL